jgi:hypothetical protein
LSAQAEIFKLLEGTEYLLTGGLASIIYGVPRHTLDIDILIPHTSANEVIKKFKIFGIKSISTEEGQFPIEFLDYDYMAIGNVVTFGGKVKVDVITLKEDFNNVWQKLWNKKFIVIIEDVEVPTISIDDLIEFKVISNRPIDKEDVSYLTEIKRRDWESGS